MIHAIIKKQVFLFGFQENTAFVSEQVHVVSLCKTTRT